MSDEQRRRFVYDLRLVCLCKKSLKSKRERRERERERENGSEGIHKKGSGGLGR